MTTDFTPPEGLAETLNTIEQPAPEPVDPSDPTSWLNYRGDVRGSIPDVMGPDDNGELRYPVIASYDPETDMTQVGLSKMVPSA